jgi:hypothetical protein
MLVVLLREMLLGQKWFVWRKKGIVINGFVWGECIGKWKL